MELLQHSFSDLYINSNKDFYISDEKYQNSLKRVEPDDKEEFYTRLLAIAHKTSSYSMNYKGTFFRVENVMSVNGELYCLRRMPLTIPSIHNLNFDHRFVQYMLSLSTQKEMFLSSSIVFSPFSGILMIG